MAGVENLNEEIHDKLVDIFEQEVNELVVENNMRKLYPIVIEALEELTQLYEDRLMEIESNV